MKGRCTLIIIAAVFAAASAHAASFVNIGPGSSTGMSADGSVVAVNVGSSAAIWSWSDGLKILGPGATAGVAIRSGSVVVGANVSGNAWRWDGSKSGVGTWTQLPLVGGTTSWVIYCTVASDTAGGTGNTWFGGSTNEPTGSRKACRYKQSSNSSTTLQLPAGGNNDSYIYGMSDDGYYAGRYQFGAVSPSGSRQAMGGSTLIALNNLMGPPSTATEAVANCMSRDHMVIGGWSSYPGGPSGYRQALIWSGANWGVLTPIPFIGTDNYSETQVLSGDGSKAAGYARNLTAGTRRCWIWDATNGTRDLASVLSTAGVDMTGWQLTDVKGMSADGNKLAGNGLYNGVASAWAADLTPTKPTVGIANRAAVDPLVATVAGNYSFVVWGKVLAEQYVAGSQFLVDDGSGVGILVLASGHTVNPGEYVRAWGTLDPAGPITLTVANATTDILKF